MPQRERNVNRTNEEGEALCKAYTSQKMQQRAHINQEQGYGIEFGLSLIESWGMRLVEIAQV